METFFYSKYTSLASSLLSFKRTQLTLLLVAFFSLTSFAQQTYAPDAILTAPVSQEGIANFLKGQTTSNAQARVAGEGEIESPIFGGIQGPDSVCSFTDPVTYSVAVTTDANGNSLQFFWFIPQDWTVVSGQGTNEITVIPGSLSGQVAVFAVGYCICSYACKPVVSEDCGTIAPLPVKLMSFEAARAQSSVLLRWATAQEIDNDRFEIERSHDGRNFTRVGAVKGKGTTNSQVSYSFEDRAPLNSVAYYRLKQVDFNGKFEYSPVRAVKQGQATASVNVYPNPATDFVTLQADELDQNSVINVTSVTGQLVYSASVRELSASQNRINISHLKSGIYIATISSGQNTQSVRIVKN